MGILVVLSTQLIFDAHSGFGVRNDESSRRQLWKNKALTTLQVESQRKSSPL